MKFILLLVHLALLSTAAYSASRSPAVEDVVFIDPPSFETHGAPVPYNFSDVESVPTIGAKHINFAITFIAVLLLPLAMVFAVRRKLSTKRTVNRDNVVTLDFSKKKDKKVHGEHHKIKKAS